MSTIRKCTSSAAIVVAALAAETRAAVTPFVNPGATAFSPEISIVNSGAVLDAQAVVSADRKYVTLNMRPTNSSLLALREFTFQQGNNVGGLVGMPPAAAAAPANAAAKTAPPKIQAAPIPPSILQRPGMTRLDNR